MRFSDHDKKLWSEMADLCERFLNRQASVKSLVTGLEGLLGAGEFGDKELRDRWYSFWLPLEIRNATGEVGWSPDAAREAEAMRTFIYDAIGAEAPPNA